MSPSKPAISFEQSLIDDLGNPSSSVSEDSVICGLILYLEEEDQKFPKGDFRQRARKLVDRYIEALYDAASVSSDDLILHVSPDKRDDLPYDDYSESHRNQNEVDDNADAFIGAIPAHRALEADRLFYEAEISGCIGRCSQGENKLSDDASQPDGRLAWAS